MKVLRHREMFASLYVGVLKEDFDRSLGFRKVARSEGSGDRHNVVLQYSILSIGSPGLRVPISHLRPPEREVLLITGLINPRRRGARGQLIATRLKASRGTAGV
jgi:hypothetical protein